MTSEIRWRIISLQVVLVVVLAFTSGFLYWAANFTHGQVHDQLVAQVISFPAANSSAITSLPTADAQAMTQYAGQALDNGDKAQVYANHFIGVHLKEIGGGKTYSQESAIAMANPKDTKAAATVQTLFRGEMLRATLLNSYGWWTVGSYALYAAIGLTVAALVVLGSLIFELVYAPRRVSSGSQARPTTQLAHA